VALVTYRVPDAGAPSVATYWNFTDGAPDAGPFDKAKHLKPYSRIGSSGDDPDFKLQVCPLPQAAFSGRRTYVHVYALTPQGDRAEIVLAVDPTIADEVLGLDSKGA
jgi:hypothetical protein